MTRALASILAMLATLGVLGCGDDGGFVRVAFTDGSLTVVAVSDCPRCDDSSTDDSFGRFTLLSNVTRATASAILSVCGGFAVVGDRDGNAGRPLQIASCGGGVELAFPSDQLSAFALRPGFNGRFGNGIRIGDSLQDVLMRDPGLRQVDPFTFVRGDGTRRVEANFDLNLRLRELVVGRGFVR